MLDYHMDLSPSSTWRIVTPTPAALKLPFFLTEIGQFSAGKEYYTQRSGQEGFLFFYTMSGKGKLDTGKEIHPLPPGSLLFLSCEHMHRYETLEAPWHFWWFHFGGMVSEYVSIFNQPFFLTHFHEEQGVEQCFSRLFHLSAYSDLAAVAQSSHEISRLLTEQVTCAGVPEEGAEGGREDIYQVVSFIQTNFHKPITIDQLAKEVHLSKYHLIRLFRRQMGTTPYQYLLHCRINMAKRLLCSSSFSIGSIASHVGFTDESHFISRFRSVTGKTPALYRSENMRYDKMFSFEEKR